MKAISSYGHSSTNFFPFRDGPLEEKKKKSPSRSRDNKKNAEDRMTAGPRMEGVVYQWRLYKVFASQRGGGLCRLVDTYGYKKGK